MSVQLSRLLATFFELVGGCVWKPGMQLLLIVSELRRLEEVLEQIRLESPCECTRRTLCSNTSEGYVVSIAVLKEIEPLDPR